MDAFSYLARASGLASIACYSFDFKLSARFPFNVAHLIAQLTKIFDALTLTFQYAMGKSLAFQSV